jgi:hypothetical protein
MGWEAVLGILVVVRYIVVLSLYVIGLLLVALNELFLSGANKAAIKEKIEDFWLFTAELSTAQKLSEALKARRAGTKKRIPMFIKLFWFLLFIVFCGSVGTTFKQGSSEIRKNIVSSVVFDMTFEITRTYLTVRNSLLNVFPTILIVRIGLISQDSRHQKIWFDSKIYIYTFRQ